MLTTVLSICMLIFIAPLKLSPFNSELTVCPLIGIEHIDDLKMDLDQALAAVS